MNRIGRKPAEIIIQGMAGDTAPFRAVYVAVDLTGFVVVATFDGPTELVLRSDGPNPRVTITTTAPSGTPNTVGFTLTSLETRALLNSSPFRIVYTAPNGDTWTHYKGRTDFEV